MKSMNAMIKKIFLGIGVLMLPYVVQAQSLKLPTDWTQNVTPFRIAGNIYYVGTQGLGAYLITSGHQAILLDTSLPENVRLIEQNIQQLGFKLSDVKLIIPSHAHWDHVGALAQMQKDTGAKVVAMQQDVAALKTGKPIGENTFQEIAFRPVQVDKVVQDGDSVKLGKIQLKAILTPGHTPGCTTWSTAVQEQGQTRTVVFPCSISVAGNVLIGNQQYPEIVRDYRQSFARLKNMQADIVLTSHPDAAGIMARKAKYDAGQQDAFIDPQLLPQIVKEAEAAFDKALASSKQ